MKMLAESGFVAIDFETTGLRPEAGDRVIEVGAIKVMNATPIAEFHALVRCGQPIPRKIIELTGITPQMLQEGGMPSEVFPALAAFVNELPLVAHNMSFDIKFLHSEFKRVGLNVSSSTHCTLSKSRSLLKLRSYRLDAVAASLGVAQMGRQRHRALDDARTAAAVWCALERRYSTLSERAHAN